MTAILVLVSQLRGQLPPEYIGAYVTVEAFVGSLSIIGCLFNVIVTLVLRSWKYTGRMVISLSIMDLLASFSNVLQIIPIESRLLCRLESFLRCFGFGGSFAWTCCFAHSLNVILKDNGNVNMIDVYFTKYTILSVAIAFLNGGLAFWSEYKTINPDDGFCIHANSNSGVVINLVVDTIPSIISILYCCYCYLKVAKKLKQLSSRNHAEVLFYPLILIICTIPKSFRELWVFFARKAISPPFYITSSAFFQSQGLWNGLAYGLTRSILEGCKKSDELSNHVSLDESLTADFTVQNGVNANG